MVSTFQISQMEDPSCRANEAFNAKVMNSFGQTVKYSLLQTYGPFAAYQTQIIDHEECSCATLAIAIMMKFIFHCECDMLGSLSFVK